MRFKGKRLRMGEKAMLIASLVVIVVWIFTLALCRAAGDADRYEEELECRRRKEAREG